MVASRWNPNMISIRLLACAPLLAAAVIAHGAEPEAPRALNDAELRGVSMQSPPIWRPAAKSLNGSAPPLQRLAALIGGGAKTGDAGPLLFPMLGLINADVTSKDVVYGPNGAALKLNADGSFNLPLPLSIGEIDLQNIRTGQNDSTSFGAIQIRGIDMGRSVITITPTR